MQSAACDNNITKIARYIFQWIIPGMLFKDLTQVTYVALKYSTVFLCRFSVKVCEDICSMIALLPCTTRTDSGGL